MRGSQTIENVGDKAAKPTLASGLSNSLEVAARSATDARDDVGEPTLAGGCPSLLGVPTRSADNEVDLELASSRPNPLEVTVCSAMDTRDNVGWLTLADSRLRLLEAVARAATGAGENVGGPTLADGCLGLLEALARSVTGMGENASGPALADGRLGLLEALVRSAMGTGENASGPALADGRLKLLEALARSATSTGENVSGPTLASGRGGSLQVAVHSDRWRDNMGRPTLAGSCLGSLEGVARSATGAGENVCGPTLSGSRPSPRTHIPAQDEGVRVAEPRALAGTSKLTIRIPARSTICDPGPVAEDKSDTDEETTIGRRTFCLLKHHVAMVEMMECHFCAHPLIPGYSAPTPEGIKAWAVKQIYEYCVLHDLPNLWAYLWENWYRRGRWELWARSGEPGEIPRLKTTMLVEGQ